MEILAETTHWVPFLAITALFIGFGVYITIDLILHLLKRKFILASLIGMVFVLWSVVFIRLITVGPDVTYKATITDFNEVYHNGYEIVDREGEIYILRKVDDDE